jgi:phospholipid/cholesterol/gamma-HCH transport system substrate-binding protein
VNKNPPTVGRLAAMVLFALSCFGLLLFLWLSFGGPVPLKPKGYQFRIAFPEAPTLAQEADVRVAGIPVGKVRKKERSPDGNTTIATIEMERRFAPVATDARAILRQKSLLGETYVELTTGDRSGPRIPEGGLLDARNVDGTVEVDDLDRPVDEILNSLDPFTRQAFRTWQQSLAEGIRGRGQDLNDAFGSLPGFVEAGGDLTEVLDAQRGALKGLVKNTGVTFAALTRREDQLRNLIENQDTTFTAIAREREAFAETWQVFPTFLDESRQTFRRLDRFSRNTEPLVREMQPALDDLGPTLEAVGDFAPDLRRFFRNFDPLITESKKSLPQTREVFDGLRPLLGELGPFLGEVNPILDWLGQHEHTLTDIMANLGVATNAKTKTNDPNGVGHYLRQFGPSGAETAAIYPNRLSSNRGNAYINPLALVGPDISRKGIIPSFDCRNAGGDKQADPRAAQPRQSVNLPQGTGGTPACTTQGPYRFQGRLQRFPHVEREDYSQPTR